MPTYEYACLGCGNMWEEIQKITEAPLTECPKCHAATAKRQISGGNFILKGGGWYADLYSSSKPKADKSAGSSEAKSETKTETKSDAKKDGGSSGSSGGGTSGSGAAPSGSGSSSGASSAAAE